MAWLYGFALVAGIINALQPGANATLSKILERPFLAALIALAVNAAAMLGIGLVTGQLTAPASDKWGAVPWWAWLGGLFGATYLMSQLLVSQQMGAGAFMGVTVTTAVVVSLALDHFGLMGFAVHPVNAARVIGGLLMIVGVGLVARF
jgi:transporter family-2 protein